MTDLPRKRRQAKDARGTRSYIGTVASPRASHLHLSQPLTKETVTLQRQIQSSGTRPTIDLTQWANAAANRVFRMPDGSHRIVDALPIRKEGSQRIGRLAYRTYSTVHAAEATSLVVDHDDIDDSLVPRPMPLPRLAAAWEEFEAPGVVPVGRIQQTHPDALHRPVPWEVDLPPATPSPDSELTVRSVLMPQTKAPAPVELSSREAQSDWVRRRLGRMYALQDDTFVVVQTTPVRTANAVTLRYMEPSAPSSKVFVAALDEDGGIKTRNVPLGGQMCNFLRTRQALSVGMVQLECGIYQIAADVEIWVENVDALLLGGRRRSSFGQWTRVGDY